MAHLTIITSILAPYKFIYTPTEYRVSKTIDPEGTLTNILLTLTPTNNNMENQLLEMFIMYN